MRGVSAGDYSYATEPAVGIYVDDVYHNTMFGSALDLSDLDRVEVKRGPQGTLSGFANIAGTISLYSKVPRATTRASSRPSTVATTTSSSRAPSIRRSLPTCSCGSRASRSGRTVTSTSSTSAARCRSRARRSSPALSDLRQQRRPAWLQDRRVRRRQPRFRESGIALRAGRPVRNQFHGCLHEREGRGGARGAHRRPPVRDGRPGFGHQRTDAAAIRHPVRQPLPAPEGSAVLGPIRISAAPWRASSLRRCRTFAARTSRARPEKDYSLRLDYDITDKIT